MNKKKLFKGLSATLLTLTGFAVGMTMIMLENDGSINQFLNIETSTTAGNSAEPVYKSKYGELSDSNLEKLKSDIDEFIAYEEEEGAVLLENDGTLPLQSSGLNVTLFGNASYNPLYKNASAGGLIDASRQVSLKQALENIGYNVNEAMFNAYSESDAVRESKEGTGSTIGEETRDFYTDELLNSLDGYKDAAIVTFARLGGEGFDLNISDADGVPQLSLHQQEKDLLDLIHEQGFEKIIVLINSGHPMELHELKEHHVNACLWIGTPGLTGFNGVANIINGTVNPSGRVVDTYAINSLSSPAMKNFGDYHFTNKPDLNYVVNAEGIYVGYKYYETRYFDYVVNQYNARSTVGSSTTGEWKYENEVLYPFGYGLSYTEFSKDLTSVTYDENTDTFTLTVAVTNEGEVAGKDVIEVYLNSPYTDYDKTNHVEKAAVQLVGFEKTEIINPHETKTYQVTVDRYLCASYDYENIKGYILDEGDYYFSVADNSHDATNNILAALGYDITDGMTENGNANNTYKWTVNELDKESYRYSDTNKEVTNVFVGDYAVDINDFYDEDVVTYLSRQDWQGTFPITYDSLEASDKLINATASRTYQKDPNGKKLSDFTQGVNSDIQFVDVAEYDYNDPRWETFLNQLTYEELGYAMNNNTGTRAVESINKPSNRDADGPDGYAFNYTYGDKSEASCYAGQIVAASSFNKELLRELGNYLGEECLYSRGNMIFAPGVNLHRTPYGGRNFEYYSEDSIFSYIAATQETMGMAEKGLIPMPKHFAANDQETNRSELCTFMTEQRMRQECLKAFEGCLTSGYAKGVMGMMGRIGAKADTCSYPLMTTILKEEWGCKGLVITDAGGAENDYQPTVDCILAGTDMFCLTSRSSVYLKTMQNNDDGDLLEALRDLNKRYYYIRSRSNLINGLTHESKVSDVMPWWKIVLFTIDGVIAAGLVATLTIYIISEVKHKKLED